MAFGSYKFLIISFMLVVARIQAEKFTFQFYEHAAPENEIPAFGPEDDEIGRGFVYENVATKTSDSSSEVYGSASGFYFILNNSTSDEIFSFTFRDFGEKGGRFANAQLHLRGLWNLESDGSDSPKQQMAVLGGSFGLTGASGSVEYSKTKKNVWLVEGNFEIEDCIFAPVNDV